MNLFAFRKALDRVLHPIVSSLAKLPFSANAWTMFGALVGLVGGAALFYGMWWLGFVLLIVRGLVDNAAKMGRHFTEAAWALDDPWIGDVRFTGLLGGIELVKNRETKEILGKAEIGKIKDGLHALGMLITVSGLHGNVLRLQPPLSITASQIDQLLAALRKTLHAVRSGT